MACIFGLLIKRALRLVSEVGCTSGSLGISSAGAGARQERCLRAHKKVAVGGWSAFFSHGVAKDLPGLVLGGVPGGVFPRVQHHSR